MPGSRDLAIHALRGGLKEQRILAVRRDNLESAEPAHRLRDPGSYRRGDGKAGKAVEGLHDGVGGIARARRVPQGERRYPIGVQMLRGFLEFGERDERVTRLDRPRRVHVEEDRAVSLDN
jgi:hypothetical protein